LDPDIPLIVPEINAGTLNISHKNYANPNCVDYTAGQCSCATSSEIPYKRIVVATYQSVTGTGIRAVRQLEK